MENYILLLEYSILEYFSNLFPRQYCTEFVICSAARKLTIRAECTGAGPLTALVYSETFFLFFFFGGGREGLVFDLETIGS